MTAITDTKYVGLPARQPQQTITQCPKGCAEQHVKLSCGEEMVNESTSHSHQGCGAFTDVARLAKLIGKPVANLCDCIRVIGK